jgi:group I intron endonuclease
LLLDREDYYILNISPEYNILQKAGSRLGYKVSEETRVKMSGSNHHMFGKTHSEETLKKLSEAKKGKNHPMFGKARIVGSGKPSQKLEVTNIDTNEKTCYDSISAAAIGLKVHNQNLSRYLLQDLPKKPYKKKYTIKKLSGGGS